MTEGDTTAARPARNDAWVDGWTVIHLLSGVVLGLVLPWYWAMLVLVLWEPFEVLLLSRLLARRGVVFGNETLRNSLTDIVADGVGVAIAVALQARLG